MSVLAFDGDKRLLRLLKHPKAYYLVLVTHRCRASHVSDSPYLLPSAREAQDTTSSHQTIEASASPISFSAPILPPRYLIRRKSIRLRIGKTWAAYFKLAEQNELLLDSRCPLKLFLWLLYRCDTSPTASVSCCLGWSSCATTT